MADVSPRVRPIDGWPRPERGDEWPSSHLTDRWEHGPSSTVLPHSAWPARPPGPSEPSPSVERRTSLDDVPMFSLVGPFDARRAEELRLLMIEATGPRIRQEVMLDVSRVSLDSAVTVDSLAWLSRELTTSGRKLILVGQTPAAERQMEGAAVHDAGAAGADRGEAPVVYAPSGNIAPGFASELIHRIFGTGLRLAGIRSLVCDGPATEELAGVIEDLDSIIKEIRTAAFVHRGTEEQGGGRNEAGNEDPWPEGPGS